MKLIPVHVWMWICSIAKAVGEGQGQQEMQQQQDTQAQQHPPGPVKQMSQQLLADQQVEQEAEKSYVQRLGDFFFLDVANTFFFPLILPLWFGRIIVWILNAP